MPEQSEIDSTELGVWRRHVAAEIAPLLAGRDLRAGGSFEVACREIADALFPQVESCGRDVASAYKVGLADGKRNALTQAADALGSGPTMRHLYERESCDWWGDRPVADWLRERAEHVTRPAAEVDGVHEENPHYQPAGRLSDPKRVCRPHEPDHTNLHYWDPETCPPWVESDAAIRPGQDGPS